MILFIAAALAESPPPAPPALPGPAGVDSKFKAETHGELRFFGTLPPNPVVDTEGHTVGQEGMLDSRLRAGLGAQWKGVRLRTELDLFSGQLAGDAWDIRGTEDARDRHRVDVLDGEAFQARRISVDGRLGPLAMEMGLVTSHWGLGLVANDGSHDPEFGRSDFGDRVLRLRAATRPFEGKPLTFVIAGDRVIADDTADWSPLTGEGQAAWQGVASVIYGDAESAKAGAYGVYRHQTEADLVRTTSVGVIDLYGDVPLKFSGGSLRLAAEAALIVGESSRVQSYNSREGLEVRSGGAVALAELTPAKLPARLVLRGGFASGDENPDDGVSSDFSFDRDLDAGMVLFDELQGAIDAAAYAQVDDEAHSGGAPLGAELMVGEGALRAATFIQPVVAVKPVPWLELKAGVSAAWATKPIAQPFATLRAGGSPTNHLGQATSGYALGTEVDWAVKVGDLPIGTTPLQPALLVQGGHLFASENLGGETLTLLSAAARLRW